jgi:hypothetical protein
MRGSVALAALLLAGCSRAIERQQTAALACDLSKSEAGVDVSCESLMPVELESVLSTFQDARGVRRTTDVLSQRVILPVGESRKLRALASTGLTLGSGHKCRLEVKVIYRQRGDRRELHFAPVGVAC